jgi:hypothetical protein
VERAEQREVLIRRGHNLVLGLEAEPAQHGVATVRRRRRQRDLRRLHADECREAAS